MINRIIVADTGPLIALALTDTLQYLPNLYDNIQVPMAVYSEATIDISKPGAKKIQQAYNKQCFSITKVKLNSEFADLIQLLDQGEAEAILLAKTLDAIALIDEKRGRKVANYYGVTVTGTAAILVQLKRKGLIKQVRPLLITLDQQGYRLSKQLKNAILKLADE